jgi:hypothetical protein
MNRRPLLALMAISLATTAFVTPSIPKWPPWLSIESPVNPYDPSARGALLLVHATFREGQSNLKDLTGSAEGMVNGARRSVQLRFENTNRRSTTALVAIDPAGRVASIQVPTEVMANGDRVPRAVSTREVDSLLTATARR